MTSLSYLLKPCVIHLLYVCIKGTLHQFAFTLVLSAQSNLFMLMVHIHVFKSHVSFSGVLHGCSPAHVKNLIQFTWVLKDHIWGTQCVM